MSMWSNSPTRFELLAREKAAVEALLHMRCKSDYFTFMKAAFPIDAKWNWHHRVVCGVLGKFVRHELGTQKLMIFMPPQHGKTTMQTEFLPAWALGLNPDLRILLLMYDASQAARYNRKIQRILTCPIYKNVFPGTAINEKNVIANAKESYVRNSHEFEIIGKQGSLISAGVGGGIAGKPAKLILMDDVIKNAEEASSVTYREKVWNWYVDEVEARLHNDSLVTFTITRRHEDDLAGRILKRDGTIEEGGEWMVLKFPAIKEDDSNPYDIYRNIGDALFPEMHSLERMRGIQEKNPNTFARMYQQRPSVQEGNILKRENFEIKNRWEVPAAALSKERVRFSVDTAYTKATMNDPSGILAYTLYEGVMYVLNFASVRFEFGDLVQFISVYVEEFGDPNRSMVNVEPKASGKSVVQQLKTQHLNGGVRLLVRELPMSGSKEERASTYVQPNMEGGRVVFVNGSWLRPFIEVCAEFPNGAHDEEIDVLSLACYDCFGMKKMTTRRKIAI